MARKARQQSSTDMYHVMVRGLNKNSVFKENREKTRILNLIRENLSKYEVEIYAYCIMHNHFHLLIKADLKELASFMAKILAAFAKYYNFKHQRVGYVFQDRYKSQCVENESYFWNCMRYIHRNPSKTKDMQEILHYKYSSVGEFYLDARDIVAEQSFEMMENRFQSKQEFLEFHRNNGWEIFDDIDEDMQDHNIQIAKEILSGLSWKYKLSELEILEYVRTREEYEEQLADFLQISKKKLKNIEKELLTQLKRDRL